jgi:hypothetical protein
MPTFRTDINTKLSKRTEVYQRLVRGFLDGVRRAVRVGDF